MTINELVDDLFEIDASDSEVDNKWLSKVAEFRESGGDICALTNRNNWQLIHVAAANGLDKSVEWLVNNGADINSRDEQGCTPLLLAFDLDIDGAIQNGEEVDFSHSRKLISFGAEQFVKDGEGKSLEDIAAVYGKKMLSAYKRYFE